MSTIIETVNASGDISFGQGEGIDIRITEQDETGTVDLSATTRTFEIQGVDKRDLVEDPDNATGARILLTTSDLQQVNSARKFWLRDETAEGVILWEGYIFKRI